MKMISDGSVDMILCDLPYQTTKHDWDFIIPFDQLWAEYKRVIRKAGVVVLTGSQPFTSQIVMSNPRWFRHEWIWHKNRGSNFASLKHHPFKEHESVLIFGEGRLTYNPIMQERTGAGADRLKYDFKNTKINSSLNGGKFGDNGVLRQINPNGAGKRYPSSVQKFNTEVGLHPTQKPVALFEYLIRTYTNKGDLVLDNCAGSGTTAIACLNTGRDYILIERDPEYFKIINARVAFMKPKKVISQLSLF